MKRTMSLLLVLSVTSLLVAHGDGISASEPEVVYVNEPVKSTTIEQADDYSPDVTVKEKDGATQEVVAQESDEEREMTDEQDEDLQSEKSDEVMYEEYT